MARGVYLVVEGNDGTGKSTQVDMLARYVEAEYKLPVYVMHEPAGAPIADEIRHIIKNADLKRDAITNLLLFTACRHETWVQEALPILNRGGVVLSARNSLSTEVYQGSGEGLDKKMIREVTAQFTDQRYMNPDLTIVLTVDDQTRQKRIKNRGELEKPDTFESRDHAFQQKLNDGYKQAAAEYGYPTIDASQSIEQIQTNIRQKLTKLIG